MPTPKEYTDAALLARRLAIAIEDVTTSRPVLMLACGGYSDEHWQIWLDARRLNPMPDLLVELTGWRIHPDGDARRGGPHEWLEQRLRDRMDGEPRPNSRPITVYR